MDPFQLTEDAIFDIDVICLYLREREGTETADRIVNELKRADACIAISESALRMPWEFSASRRNGSQL